MRNQKPRKIRLATWISFALLPVSWIFIKYIFGISDRYLPSLFSIVDAAASTQPDILLHFTISSLRFILGYTLGVAFGLMVGIQLYKSKILEEILLPNLQLLRAVPPAATIPFFILWFGFSEFGKIFIIIFGIATNLAIAVFQILTSMPEKYRIALRSYGFDRHRVRLSTLTMFALERLLPTLRFSLMVAIGLVVVAEYLGAQSGLGYVLQSARTTFSLNVLLLCATLFGIITWIADKSLIAVWRKMIPWDRDLKS